MWSGVPLSGWVTVDAPIGRPPIFWRKLLAPRYALRWFRVDCGEPTMTLWAMRICLVRICLVVICLVRICLVVICLVRICLVRATPTTVGRLACFSCRTFPPTLPI